MASGDLSLALAAVGSCPFREKNGIVRQNRHEDNRLSTLPQHPSQTGRLLSIQAGRVQRMEMPEGPTRDGRNAIWNSGIFKSPVAGPVIVTLQGMAGDEQYDLVNHGGLDNIILAYNADHYPGWRTALNLPQMDHGWFGENFTVSGFSDEDVCIGDIWQVGPDLQ